MTNSDRMKKIEDQWQQDSDIISEESFQWLVSRVKQLTELLDEAEKLADDQVRETLEMLSVAEDILTSCKRNPKLAALLSEQGLVKLAEMRKEKEKET